MNPFTIGGATELPELYPPEHRVRSGVWKYFGYLRDTEGPADCAGFPICKICLSKVSNKGKVTANMTAHLKDHHRSIYDDLKVLNLSYCYLYNNYGCSNELYLFF